MACFVPARLFCGFFDQGSGLFRHSGLRAFLYPWKKILASRCLWVILPCFFLLLAACYLLDASHRNGGEWEAIKAWQHDRQAIADADMARVYLAQLELLRKHDLFPNDMQLLRWHFSLDAGLRDHARLASIDRESNRDLFYEIRFDKAEEALDFLLTGPFACWFSRLRYCG